jgi:Nitroreductase family
VLTATLDRSTTRAAIALANRAPSVHNSQPWRWRLGPSSVHLFADPGRALPATDPEGRDLRISCGAALHHLRVALLAAGWDARVHRLPDPARPLHLAALELRRAEPDADDLALAAAIEARRSDRRLFSTWPVPGELLDDLVGAAAGQGALLRVLVRGGEWQAVTELAERAAVVQALTPELAQETAVWTGRGREAVEGVPAANVPADPDGSVPVRHFAAGTQAQSRLGTRESDGTMLAVLATEQDSPLAQLQAGEAASAVLLAATHLGLATDPISQPLEVPEIRAELRTRLFGDRAQPQLLLRLGWAPVSASPVPSTGRRPVDETIDPLDTAWP